MAKILLWLMTLVFGGSLTGEQCFNFLNNWTLGGERVTLGEIPYQLSLRDVGPNNHICGASLVQINGYQFAITAAHCLHPDAEFYLLGGTLETFGLHKQERHVVATVIHENHNYPNMLQNDIALLFLDKPFKLGNYVNTISLPEPGSMTTSDVLVSGWCNLSRDPKFLRKVRLPTVPTKRCKDVYTEFNVNIVKSQLCAGSWQNSTCRGNNGGPAKSIDGNYLAGIVVGGVFNGFFENIPKIFTKVSDFMPWINNAVSSRVSRQSAKKKFD